MNTWRHSCKKSGGKITAAYSGARCIHCGVSQEEAGPLANSESDPTGRSANESGAKLDAGKNRLGLVLFGFSRALQEVGKVGTYGAEKYTDNGWVDVPDGERRYTDAMLRHLMKEAAGEKLDPDTELLHAAHAAWNALARLDLAIRAKEAKQDGSAA